MQSYCAYTPNYHSKDLSLSLSQRLYEKFCKIIYEKSRIALGSNKKELLVSRISKRLGLCKIKNYQEYYDFINSIGGEQELVSFIDAISTNHTYFFREPQHFDFLKANALPDIISRKQPNAALKIWCAACSTGEEAYTIAMVIDQFFKNAPPRQWIMLCSDISTRALAAAQNGIYSKDRLENLPPGWAHPYFEKGIESWSGFFRIKDTLRSHLQFQQLNLFSVPYPFRDSFDIIFCRNTLIYFDRPSQQEVILNLVSHLAPGGYLMTGHSESLAGINHPLRSIQSAVYQKKPT